MRESWFKCTNSPDFPHFEWQILSWSLSPLSHIPFLMFYKSKIIDPALPFTSHLNNYQSQRFMSFTKEITNGLKKKRVINHLGRTLSYWLNSDSHNFWKNKPNMKFFKGKMLILKLSFLWVLLILYRRQNLTPISNIREAAPRSLFWDPYGLNRFLEVCFAFPFSLIGKSTMAFSTGQSWCVQSQILVHRWGPENKDFSAVL